MTLTVYIPLIEVRNISKSYRRDRLEIPVLRDITLSVAEGYFVAVLRCIRLWKSNLAEF